MTSIQEQRKTIASLFDLSSPADAPSAYYALYHDPSRSALFSKDGEDGRSVGYVGRFQTGIDLFRPLVNMRCWEPEAAADLLGRALVVGRPYLLFANVNQIAMVGGSLEINNQRILLTYVLDAALFKPVINVMVVEKKAPDGTPRMEIHSGGLQAVAGLNWQSPKYGEIYVHTEPEARQRGWGRSVVAACVQAVLATGRLPIYLVERDNTASVQLAESLGFVDTGARQIFADAVYLGHPGDTQQ